MKDRRGEGGTRRRREKNKRARRRKDGLLYGKFLLILWGFRNISSYWSSNFMVILNLDFHFFQVKI
jgi:hypothetical protein